MAVSKRFGAFNRFTVRIQALSKGEVQKTETFTVFTTADFDGVSGVVQRALAEEFGDGDTEPEPEPEPEPAPVTVKPRIRRKA